MTWVIEPTASAQANLSAYLAGFAVTIIAILIGQFSRSAPTETPFRKIEETITRMLLASFVILVISAIFWGTLGGDTADTRATARQIADDPILAVNALGCVTLLALGAMTFLAGIIEMISLQFARHGTDPMQKDVVLPDELEQLPSRRLRRISRSSRHVYLGATALAIYELAYFTGGCATTATAGSWFLPLFWVLFGGLVAAFYVVAVKGRMVTTLLAVKEQLTGEGSRSDSRSEALTARRFAGVAAALAVIGVTLLPETWDGGVSSVRYWLAFAVTCSGAFLAAVTFIMTLVLLGRHADDAVRQVVELQRDLGLEVPDPAPEEEGRLRERLGWLATSSPAVRSKLIGWAEHRYKVRLSFPDLPAPVTEPDSRASDDRRQRPPT